MVSDTLASAVEKIRAALNAGPTPGPWRIGTPPPNGEQTIGAEGLMVAVATTGGEIDTIANAAYIVAANPEVIRDLLAERDALAKDAARYRALKEMAALSDMPGYAEIVYSIVIPTGVDQASHVFRGDPLPDLDAVVDAAMEGGV